MAVRMVSERETHKVVFVVEVEVPDDYAFSATHAAASAVMDAVTTKTALPTRAWVSIAEVADAVIAAVQG